MKPSGAPGLFWCAGLPLAVFQHPGLVVLGNRFTTAFADVGCRFRLATRPAQLFKAQPLAVLTMWTRNEVAALIRCFEFAVHRTGPGNRRGRDDQDLAPGKGAGSRLGQRDRITFAFHIQWVAVDLVEKQVAHRHGTQAHRAVGDGHHQHATMELFGQDGVAGVPTARRGDALLDGRAFLDQRINALLGGPLGHLHRGPHRHHRARGVVDHVSHPVQAQFGAAHLRAFHEYHPLDRRHRGQAIHDLAQVGRAAGAPAARFGGSLAGEHPVLVGPLGHREQRIGGETLAPGTLDGVPAFVVKLFHHQSTDQSTFGCRSPRSCSC